jgi:hypothetical protein
LHLCWEKKIDKLNLEAVDMKEDVSGGGKKEAIDLHRRLLPRAMKQPTISFFYLLSWIPRILTRALCLRDGRTQ